MKKSCLNCKQEFEKQKTESKSRWQSRQYCSRECYYKTGQYQTMKHVCYNCGKSFIARREKELKYCSHKCKNQHQPYWLGKQRSEETNEKISLSKRGHSPVTSGAYQKGEKPWNVGKEYKQIRGEKHWNWKGGITDLTKKIRNSVEYNKWRMAVYRRDYWTCQECKVKQKYPVAHHIKTFAEYPELRFDVDNGITLCRACHKKVHDEIGYTTRFKSKCK